MRTEQLRYFIEIAKSGSFTTAAEQLHISQPSISQAISNLEQELGVKLFERSRYGIKLTSVGQSILLKAQGILNIMEEIILEADSEAKEVSGRLRIAAIPSICDSYLSDVLSNYKNKFPHVRIEVKEVGTNQIIQDVLADHVDIGIISSYPNEQFQTGIEYAHLLTGTYVVYVGKNSTIPFHKPLAKNVIAELPLIMLQRDYRQEAYAKKLLQTDRLNILLTLGYTDAAKKIIAEGIAIGFYPDFLVKNDPYVRSGDIIPVDILDNNLTLSFGWIHKSGRRLSDAADRFIKTLRATIQG
ncbi:LysR family transcriptional regulator [Paenibacillus sp. VMFN-D1]|uniref:LysR family transcriptional regulator n=1 Tax=Paenibacillus sp. VMFN-D1 TaxID=2135608 RepID=UPI000E265994|nr:LysR family transcriptional regulator [Paenibacillus sp. VMFN-D1]RED41837.1 DNA-binding transcriptional LysR family regulator [Paenibacillus sp. VMFN-D1]